MDEVKFKREMAEEKQNGRDQKRATDEANLKAKRAQEKQNERDQKRATDEANLKAKRVEEKQNERDQERATDIYGDIFDHDDLKGQGYKQAISLLESNAFISHD